MHIVKAFLDFTSLGARKIHSIFVDDSAEVLVTANEEIEFDGTTERSALLWQPARQASLTSHYENFSHSSKALRLCLYHVVVYYALGVLGFSFVVERWSFVDSFYYATVVCTTIGYGDLFPKTTSAKLYTIFLTLYGIVILGIFLGVVGEYLVSLHNKTIQLRRRKVSSTVVHVLALETDAQNDLETQAVLNGTKEELELKENSLWEDIYSIVILEAPIVGVLLLLSLGAGYLEGWSFIDSTYWLVITGTTVGFGDIFPTRDITRILSCFFFPLLVAVLGELLARIASVYMEHKEQQSEKEFLSRALTMDDITKMDTNKSGEVDKAEFLSYMLITLQKVSQEDIDEIANLFHKLDKTGDGLLSVDDLKIRGQQVNASLLLDSA